MVYHIGLIKGTGRVQCWGNNHRSSTVVVQMRKDKDYLSPDLWVYYGKREVTKAHVRDHKPELLQAINKQYGTEFTCLIVD